MSINTVVGYNGRYCHTSVSFTTAGMTVLNCLLIYKILDDGSGFATFDPKKPQNQNQISGFEEGSTYIIILLQAMDLSIWLTPPLPQPAVSPATVAWGQLIGTTDDGGGTLKKGATPNGGVDNFAGGTVDGGLKKITGNYVEYSLASSLRNSSGVILQLAAADDGNYAINAASAVAGVYIYNPNDTDPAILKWYTGLATAPGVEGTWSNTPVGSKVVRLQISDNDVLAKYDGTTIYTFAGVLSSVSAGDNIPIKGLITGAYGLDRFINNATRLNAAG